MKRFLILMSVAVEVSCGSDLARAKSNEPPWIVIETNRGLIGPSAYPGISSTNYASWVTHSVTGYSVYRSTTQRIDRTEFEEVQSTNKPTVSFAGGLWRVRFDGGGK